MKKSPNNKKLRENIQQSSPLYNYWKSEQNEIHEENRLAKANEADKWQREIYLFKEEPYKWETLYQSVLTEIIKGDVSSLKAFKLLLASIKISERNKTLTILISQDLLDTSKIAELQDASANDFNDLLTVSKAVKPNFVRFARILIAIFTNPYNLHIKRERKHIYEHTGVFLLNIKKIFRLA